MDMIVLSRGRIYREQDLHVQAPNGRIAIISPRYDKGGVDIIDADRCQQRRSQPRTVSTLLAALNSIADAHVFKIEHFRLLTPQGERIRVA